jgi:DNA-binding GntR family transcriptional regulator
VVVSFSPKEIEEFYAIKSILEGYAARRACVNLSNREIEKLTAINDKLRQLAGEGDLKHFFKVHSDFHETFIRACDNEKLHEMISNLVNKFQRLRLASLSMPGRMQISVQEHEKIVDAFIARDEELAEQLVRKNAEYGGRVLMEGTDGSIPLKPAERLEAMAIDI